MLFLIIFICFSAFGADAPKLGEEVSADMQARLIDLKEKAGVGELLAYVDNTRKWRYGEVVATFDSLIQMKTTHDRGTFFSTADVKRLEKRSE